MGEMPKSRAALERAIVRYAGNDTRMRSLPKWSGLEW